jgi:hypothetical protein
MGAFNPAVDPYVRATDPETSREAAKGRSNRLNAGHRFVYEYQAKNKDSERNVALAAVEAGIAMDAETGRRLCRTLKEMGFLEHRRDQDGNWLKARNKGTAKSGMRCFPTSRGEQWYGEAGCIC